MLKPHEEFDDPMSRYVHVRSARHRQSPRSVTMLPSDDGVQWAVVALPPGAEVVPFASRDLRAEVAEIFRIECRRR